MNTVLKWAGKGGTTAAVEEAQEAVNLEDRRWGFRNEGNTCYANSVLQALYFCEPFRLAVQDGRQAPTSQTHAASLSEGIAKLGAEVKVNGKPPVADGKQAKTAASARPPAHRRASSASSAGQLSLGKVTGISNGDARPPAIPSSSPSTRGVSPERAAQDDTLLSTLRELFCAISFHPKRAGVAAPHAFINQLRKQNELFRSTMHQDAHEFLGYLLNEIAEELERAQGPGPTPATGTSFSASSADALASTSRTWIHSLFEGILTNETRCLTCETITSRDESFLDLSIDIEDNSSVSACLRQFSANEMLAHKNKYSCDTCCGLQEAEKRMIVKKMPRILALHLKRFKYQEDLQRFTKLAYRVAFPAELRLFNTLPTAQPDPDLLYSLWAVVVHIGVGPHAGHYVTLLRSQGRWLCFDDEVVTEVHQSELKKYFGDTPGAGSGYVLFYEAIQVERPGQTLAHLAHDLTPAQAALLAPAQPYQSLSDADDGESPKGMDPPASEAESLPSPPPATASPEISPSTQAAPLPSTSKDKSKGLFGLGRKVTPAGVAAAALSEESGPPSPIQPTDMAAGRRGSSTLPELGNPVYASDNSDALSTSSSQPSQITSPANHINATASGNGAANKGFFGRGILSRTKSSGARRSGSGSGLSIDVEVPAMPSTPSPNSHLALSNHETISPTKVKKRSLFGSKTQT